MGISLFIVLLFIISLGLLIYGIKNHNNSIKWLSIILLGLSTGLGFIVFNLISYM